MCAFSILNNMKLQKVIYFEFLKKLILSIFYSLEMTSYSIKMIKIKIPFW